MTTLNSFNEDIERLMQEYRKRRAEAGDLQRKILQISATAAAPRQSVKVTVGVHGELTALEFPTNAYKRMAPKELTEAVLSAAREAKAKALESLQELMNPQLPNGLNYIDLIQGKADLAEALPPEPPMPDMVRDYLENGQIATRDRDGRHG